VGPDRRVLAGTMYPRLALAWGPAIYFDLGPRNHRDRQLDSQALQLLAHDL
jgi:hypothetical protein